MSSFLLHNFFGPHLEIFKVHSQARDLSGKWSLAKLLTPRESRLQIHVHSNLSQQISPILFN